MKTPTILSFSFLILLSTGAAAQTGRPTGTSGTTPPAPATGTPATSTPATSTPAPKPGATAAAANDYRLVTGDKLRVEVYNQPQVSQTLQIRPDGKITLPLIGDVAATGRTSAELTSTITTALGEYMKNPAVTVIVMETTPQTIYVMGEVNAPGPQAMKGEISILQALASAGGFKDFAKRSSIKVLRPGPTGNTTLEFNYKDAIKGEAKILMLKPGDTVIVP